MGALKTGLRGKGVASAVVVDPKREAIEREFRLFGSVIPSAVIPASRETGYRELVPGRERTTYFYRMMAIRLMKGSRMFEVVPGQRQTYIDLAKSYLKTYRERLEGRAS